VTSAEDIKSCCAAAYSSDAVRLLLGDSYHPGGAALTRRLAGHLGLAPDARVLDVACGLGSTALLLATEDRARVHGIDLSAANVALAQGAAAAAGLTDRVTFSVGDAERLPYPSGAFAAVICECVLCAVPDKPAAAAQFGRVLRAGGRTGITDVVADPARLPAELTNAAAWIACIAGARPLPGYADLLQRAGLRVLRTERHDSAMLRMIDQIEARLALVAMTAGRQAEAIGIDPDGASPVLAAARAAVAGGALGYGLLVAEKPA
jgi:SAM-dependent methyltransferase